MENLIHTHKTFEKVSFTDKKVNNREFEDCIFKNCDFSNSNFCNNIFMDCEFIDCNLSMTQLIGTSLKTVHFRNCKLLGIEFHSCADFMFGVSFQDSLLDYSSFANKKMPKTKFNTCSMKDSYERDFRELQFGQCRFQRNPIGGSRFQDGLQLQN